MHLKIYLATKARAKLLRLAFIPILRVNHFQPRGWLDSRARDRGMARILAFAGCTLQTICAGRIARPP